MIVDFQQKKIYNVFFVSLIEEFCCVLVSFEKKNIFPGLVYKSSLENDLINKHNGNWLQFPELVHTFNISTHI